LPSRPPTRAVFLLACYRKPARACAARISPRSFATNSLMATAHPQPASVHPTLHDPSFQTLANARYVGYSEAYILKRALSQEGRSQKWKNLLLARWRDGRVMGSHMNEMLKFLESESIHLVPWSCTQHDMHKVDWRNLCTYWL